MMHKQDPQTLTVQVKRLRGEDLPLPAYMTPGAAGLDLYAALDEELLLPPGQRALVPTGVALAIPAGWEAQVRPRSGLALQHGLTLLNSPGTIDSDYRGEIKVIVINMGMEEYRLQRGMRIAQLVFAPVVRARWLEVEVLEETGRGAGGFGHTGA